MVLNRTTRLGLLPLRNTPMGGVTAWPTVARRRMHALRLPDQKARAAFGAPSDAAKADSLRKAIALNVDAAPAFSKEHGASISDVR